MPVPSLITDLSTTAASNSPAGSESARGTVDDYIRALSAFIASSRIGTSATTYTYSGSAVRIQGDFSNATLANRTAFQDKTANGVTGVAILPNGTAIESAVTCFNNSDPTNASYGGINCNATAVRLTSAATGSGSALPLAFVVGAGGPERARFTTDGNYLIGTTSSSAAYDGASWKWVGYQLNSRNTTADTNQIVFYNPNGQVGFINTSGSATVYSTSSDYRLKSNQQPLTGSGAFIDALQPKTWAWLADGAPGVGFIAHEVAPIAPSAVSGTKDAVNADGTPSYQGVAYGSAEFIANIIAELQSLRARVAALEAA
jgi:hypothetical protein